jgi:hypothetical protein
MSVNLSTAAVKKFEKEAQQAFQEQGTNLRNAVTVRDAKGAKSVQFQVYGEVIANQRTAVHTNIPAQDPSIAIPTATVLDYTVGIYTDVFLNNQIGWDGRQSAVEAIAGALNRRLDQIIIDEGLDTASGKTVASGSDNLNVGHFAESARLLGSAVPKMDRHFLCHDDGFFHFIQETDVKTIDSNFHKPLTDAELPNFMGFNIHQMGDRDSVVVGDGLGGLALSGSDRTNYAWQKKSVGLAMNMDPKITIDFVPEKQAHFIVGKLSAGAVLLQDDGVVTITTDES